MRPRVRMQHCGDAGRSEPAHLSPTLAMPGAAATRRGRLGYPTPRIARARGCARARARRLRGGRCRAALRACSFAGLRKDDSDEPTVCRPIYIYQPYGPLLSADARARAASSRQALGGHRRHARMSAVSGAGMPWPALGYQRPTPTISGAGGTSRISRPGRCAEIGCH